VAAGGATVHGHLRGIPAHLLALGQTQVPHLLLIPVLSAIFSTPECQPTFSAMTYMFQGLTCRLCCAGRLLAGVVGGGSKGGAPREVNAKVVLVNADPFR
jgi:hypothetical protein